MEITVTGTVVKQALGMGVWTLTTAQGKVYELQQIPPQWTIIDSLPQAVKIQGILHSDRFTLAMVGEVLEVRSWSWVTAP